MRHSLIIGLLFSTLSATAQWRNNTAYADVLKFPNSFYWLSVGVDHSFKLTRKSYTAGRLYFVVSPNLAWSGYNFSNLKNFNLSDNEYPKTHFDQYQLVLPMILRFELSPNRLILGTCPGNHLNDLAVFFDIGISFNYLLSAHLHEDFAEAGYPFVFNGSITSTASSRASGQWIPFGIGFRFHRAIFFVRYSQPFRGARYTDLSKNWGLPNGVHSYFYNQWLTTPGQQNSALICLGYTF
jgi:hypothetical protein